MVDPVDRSSFYICHLYFQLRSRVAATMAGSLFRSEPMSKGQVIYNSKGELFRTLFETKYIQICFLSKINPDLFLIGA